MLYKETDFRQEPLVGEISKNWDSVDLGEVVEIHDSKRIPLNEIERNQRKGKYPYCGANGIIDHIDDYIFNGEFVLLAEDGGSYGQFENTAYIMSGKFWVNNHAHILRAMEGKTTNQFLKHVLDFLDLNPYVVGSTRKKLNQEQMKEIRLPFPPLNEQRAIVEVLGVVDLAVAETGEVIAKTERLKKGLMQELLTCGIGHMEYKQTPIGKIPTDWNVTELGSILTLQRGYDLPMSKRLRGTIPVVGSNGIVGYHDRSMTSGPGVIVGRSGSIGKVYYIREDYWPLNTCLFVKEFKGSYPKFVYYLLQKMNLARRFRTGTSVPTLNRNHVHPLKTAIPSKISEQQKIGEILSSIDEKLKVERDEKAKLERIRRGLMDLLLTGKIRVKED